MYIYPGLSITESNLLGVAAVNLVKSAKCFRYVQWRLNLMATEPNGVSGSQSSVLRNSFISPVHVGEYIILLE